MNRSRKFFPVLVPALVIAGAGILGTASASAGGRPLTAALAASNEIGAAAPGDVGATGFAALTLNQGRGEICFDLELVVTDPTRAHIHRGAPDVNGPIVVEFYETDDPAVAEGCVSVDGALVKEIRQNPAGFYVNVHSKTAPAGAVRGQLSR